MSGENGSYLFQASCREGEFAGFGGNLSGEHGPDLCPASCGQNSSLDSVRICRVNTGKICLQLGVEDENLLVAANTCHLTTDLICLHVGVVSEIEGLNLLSTLDT